MGKKTIFFDLDDTLYDRSVPYCSAFAAFFGGKYADKAQTAFERTMLRGYEVFEAAHTGQMTMEAMHIYRHQTGLRDVGIEITPEQALRMQALYAEEQRHISLTPVMEEILTFCRAHFAAMGVITNGGVQSQRDKLKSLGAARWFRPELVLISDALGVMMPEQFSKVLYNGNRIEPEMIRSFEASMQQKPIRIYDEKDHFIGIYEFQQERGNFKPVKVFMEE